MSIDVNNITKKNSFLSSRVVKILRVWLPSHTTYSPVKQDSKSTPSSEKHSTSESQIISKYLNRITFANHITLQDKQNMLVRSSELDTHWNRIVNLRYKIGAQISLYFLLLLFIARTRKHW